MTQLAPKLNYPFLLVTHMVCADQQIHSEESKALHELATQIKASPSTIDEMEKILAQEENQLSIGEIADKIPLSQQDEAMSQMLAIAYVDGFCSALERRMAEQVARVWKWPEGKIEQQLVEAGAFSDTRFIGDLNEPEKPSIGARLLKKADSLLSRALVDGVVKLTGNEPKVEQLRREILLTGTEYDEAIHQCAVIADEDYKFAKLALKKAVSILSDLGTNIERTIEDIKYKTGREGKATHAKEVTKQLEETRNYLIVELIKKIEDVQESLRSKERALNHFSITFMGRTKAGKSTLHAIVTDDGWDAIGVGKQRTTRFNRVYEWKNIRIIDTPGIGAPGGKSDEEIAKSIIDESDVICYVVTNDSIQESEFRFLKLLKEKSKPLIILLNIKNNLRDSRRLEHFFKDPHKPFEMEGKSGLRGHIERIHRYAKEHYANDYFDIIPVMLLAAQLSREPEHAKNKKELFKASRMQDFLDSIRLSLVNHGVIRRSQTLLGSTVGVVDNPHDSPYKWLIEQSLIYQKLTQTLKKKRWQIQGDIQKAAKDAKEYLKQEINRIFADVSNTIPSFAENYWNANENDLNLGWQKQQQELRVEELLNIAYQKTSQKFNNEVQEILEEIGNELTLICQLDRGNFNLNEQDSQVFKRNFARIGGSVLVVAGTVLAFFAPPVGIVLSLVGTAMNLIAGFFKSKEQKRREAVANISNLLTEQIQQHKKRVLQESEANFNSFFDSIALSIDIYFEELIQGLEKIAIHLGNSRRGLLDVANYLNKAYAKRIIDWSTREQESLTVQGINERIHRVERDFGRNMKIVTKAPVERLKTPEEIKYILQEDIVFAHLKSTPKN